MVWTSASQASQRGRYFVVTGGTSGIGYEAVLALARLGADVLFTGRREATGAARVAEIVQAVPSAAGRVSFGALDLSDLESVSGFASRLLAAGRAIDVLVLNAGAIGPGVETLSPQGVEITLATNHLGHFQLVRELLPILEKGRGPAAGQGEAEDKGEGKGEGGVEVDANASVGSATGGASSPAPSSPSSPSSSPLRPRVVLVSSIAARSASGSLAGALLAGKHPAYHSFPVYGETKLANQLFARKLQSLSDARGWGLEVTLAHPGGSATGFGESGGAIFRNLSRVTKAVLAQSAALGAEPTLRAALDPDAKPLDYYGPRWLGLWGAPVHAWFARNALDQKKQDQLWEWSEKVAGAYPQ